MNRLPNEKTVWDGFTPLTLKAALCMSTWSWSWRLPMEVVQWRVWSRCRQCSAYGVPYFQCRRCGPMIQTQTPPPMTHPSTVLLGILSPWLRPRPVLQVTWGDHVTARPSRWVHVFVFCHPKAPHGDVTHVCPQEIPPRFPGKPRRKLYPISCPVITKHSPSPERTFFKFMYCCDNKDCILIFSRTLHRFSLVLASLGVLNNCFQKSWKESEGHFCRAVPIEMTKHIAVSL